MKISFVIPCYRSQNTIEVVVKEIKDTVKSSDEYEIVLVNDCSPDDTWSAIKKLCEADKNIIGINMAKNFGQHSALMAGYRAATGDVIVSLDDDGQTPADEVYKLLDKIEEGYDVVYASYNVKKHSWFRNFGSKVNQKMTEWLINKPKKISVTSYFAMRKFVKDEMIRYENAYPYVIGLVFRSTKSICNVPVTHRERMEGSSGYSFGKLISLWMNGFTAFSVKPLRLATAGGVFVAFIGFAIALYTIIRKIINPARVMLGWSSLFSVLCIIGGLIMCMLGLIGEYIGRIYISLNSAPQYVIKEVINKQEDK